MVSHHTGLSGAPDPAVEPGLEQALAGRLAQLAAAMPKDGFSYRLELRDAGLGANAFALPGGIIVVTDELLNVCSLDEATAVLAHELAHVSERHVMQSIVLEAGIGAALAAVAGDVSWSRIGVESAPSLLIELSYSRSAEEQADEGAFAMLRRVQLPPSLLGDALEKMELADRAQVDAAETQQYEPDEPQESDVVASGARSPTPQEDARKPETGSGTSQEYDPWSFFSTHPITAERVARARAQR